jgi:hypothetical protein
MKSPGQLIPRMMSSVKNGYEVETGRHKCEDCAWTPQHQLQLVKADSSICQGACTICQQQSPMLSSRYGKFFKDEDWALAAR